MFDAQLISIIIGIFVGLGTLIAGIGFAYAQFKTGGDKAKNELIDTLRDTATAEKAERERLAEEKTLLIQSHQEQINDLKAQVGKLTGLWEASELSKKEYLQILQGRDPAQQAFMDVVLKTIEHNEKLQPAQQKFMAETAKILGEISIFMKNLNTKANKNQNFIDEVAEDTKSETGKVLRKDV